MISNKKYFDSEPMNFNRFIFDESKGGLNEKDKESLFRIFHGYQLECENEHIKKRFYIGTSICANGEIWEGISNIYTNRWSGRKFDIDGSTYIGTISCKNKIGADGFTITQNGDKILNDIRKKNRKRNQNFNGLNNDLKQRKASDKSEESAIRKNEQDVKHNS